MQTAEPDFFEPSELADRFRLSVRTIYNLIERGDLVAVRLGRSLRVRSSEAARYERENLTVKP